MFRIARGGSSMTRPEALRRLRTRAALVAVTAGSLPLLVGAPPAVAATPSTLAVVVVGPGTVASTPAGISCPAKCSASFASGTTVTVSAKTAHGSHLLRWGGACSGTGACIVNASGLDVVGAQFTAPTTRHGRRR